MEKLFRKVMLSICNPSPSAVLAVVWLLGLIFGNLALTASDDSYFLLMCEAAECPVSIVGLCTSILLPFLFSAFAVYIGRVELLYLICFVKAFLFAFALSGVFGAFSSAGWLISLLLLFSDIWFSPVLCWFWIRRISGNKGTFISDAFLCTAFAALIGSVDLWVVSPFLAMLIDI